MKTMFEKIAELAFQRKLTQAKLERITGLAENRISKWKGGQGEPGISEVVRIADALHVPVAYLVDDRLEAIPSPDIRAEERAVIEALRTSGLEPSDVVGLIVKATRERAAAPLKTIDLVPRESDKYPSYVEQKAATKPQPKRVKRKA
jgi:transcriptional regulator with XRE-family HTH domain